MARSKSSPRLPAAAPGASGDRAASRRIGMLAALWPFMSPYRALIVASLMALVLTAMLSLTLPLAVRRVVDNFRADDAAMLDQYFLAALGIAGLLAVGTGLRYALVTRLGERVVADIRKAVFDRVIGMSPAFYETHHDRRGAQPDHHRHHADPVGARLVGLDRAAQRADLRRRAGADAADLGQADGDGAADRAGGDRADPGAGAPAAQAQPREPGLDRRLLGQCLRGAGRGADGAGLHPRGGEPRAVRAT